MWPGGVVLVPCIALDFSNALDSFFQSTRHELMHLFRLIPFHKVRRPATAAQELIQLLVLDTRQNCWVADLVTIEVQDRQDGTVRDRVEKLVGLSGSRQGGRFRFTVADDTGDNQLGIVKGGSEGVT